MKILKPVSSEKIPAKFNGVNLFLSNAKVKMS